MPALDQQVYDEVQKKPEVLPKIHAAVTLFRTEIMEMKIATGDKDEKQNE